MIRPFLLLAAAACFSFLASPSSVSSSSIVSVSSKLVSNSNSHAVRPLRYRESEVDSLEPLTYSSSHTDEFGNFHAIDYQVTPLRHVYHLRPHHNLRSVQCEFENRENEEEEEENEFELKNLRRRVSEMKIHLKDFSRGLFDLLEEVESETAVSIPDVLPAGAVLVIQDIEHSCHPKQNQHRHNNTTSAPLFVRLLHPFDHDPERVQASLSLKTESGNWKDCFSKGELKFHTDNLASYHHHRQQLFEQQRDEYGVHHHFKTLATTPNSAAAATGNVNQASKKTIGWNMNKAAIKIATNGPFTLECTNCFIGGDISLTVNAKWDITNTKNNLVSAQATANTASNLGFTLTATKSSPAVTFKGPLTPSITVLPTFPLVVIGAVPVTVSIAVQATADGSASAGGTGTTTAGYGFQYTFTRGASYTGSGTPTALKAGNADVFSPTKTPTPPTLTTSASSTVKLGITVTFTVTFEMLMTLALNINPHVNAVFTAGSTSGCPKATDVKAAITGGVGTSVDAGVQVKIPFFKAWGASKALLTFPIVAEQSIYNQCKAITAKLASSDANDAEGEEIPTEENVAEINEVQEEDLEQEKELLEEVAADLRKLRRQLRRIEY